MNERDVMLICELGEPICLCPRYNHSKAFLHISGGIVTESVNEITRVFVQKSELRSLFAALRVFLRKFLIFLLAT